MSSERYADLDAASLMVDVQASAANPVEGLSESAARGLGYLWRYACRWWDAQGITVPVTEDDVVLLLAACEGNAHGTLRQLISAVRRFHDAEHGYDPCGKAVDEFMTGYARLYGTATSPAAALRPEEYQAIIEAAPRCLSPYRAARLRLSLSIAYCGWLRAHEALSIPCGGIFRDGPDYSAFVRHSKTAPAGVLVRLEVPVGTAIDIEAEVRLWHRAAEEAGVVLRAGGPLLPSVRNPAAGIGYGTYLSDLKAAVKAAGLNRRIATHSPRRGGATVKAKHYGSVEEVMAQGRWVSVEVGMGYVEEWDAYDPLLQVDYPASASPASPTLPDSPVPPDSPSSPATSSDSRSASSM